MLTTAAIMSWGWGGVGQDLSRAQFLNRQREREGGREGGRERERDRQKEGKKQCVSCAIVSKTEVELN